MRTIREKVVSAALGIFALVAPMMWPIIPTWMGVTSFAFASGLTLFAVWSWLGTKEYTGGTGKYVGLTGHAEYTGSDLKTLDKDAPEVFEGHAQGSYKLQPVAAGSNTQQLVPGHPHQ